MSFVSYAQNFEDVMLWRALKHIEKGFYVDVGAQHPVIDSVSKAFYERGWRGIHVEPVPQYAELLRKDRPDETVLQVALADTDGTLELNVIPDTGLSTAVDAYAQRYQVKLGFEHQRIQVPGLTLKSALKSLVGKDVHWLKIDVEGSEEKVLKGWDSQTLRPWVIVIEATIPGSPETDYASWDPILTAADYQFVYFDGLNRFYVAKEHAELAEAFSCPPNVFDSVQLSGLASSEFCRGLMESHQASAKELAKQNEKLATELNAVNERHVQSEVHIQWQQSEWGLAKQRVEELSQRTGRLESELESERQRALQLGGDLQAARECESQLEGHAEWQQSEWDMAKQRVEELSQLTVRRESELATECQRALQLGGDLQAALTHASQLQAHGELQQSEWDAAKQRVEELSHRSGRLESELATEREQRMRLYADLQAAREHESQLEAHAKWLQNEWDVAKQRVEELSQSAGRLEGDLETERQRALQLGSDLQAALTHASQLETHAQWQQSEWDAAKGRVEELSQRAGSLESELTTERQRTAQLGGELQSTREHESQLQAHADWQQSELDAAKARIDELNKSSHHWWTVADHLDRHVQSIYASKSWRVTAPLRFVNRWRRLFLSALISGIRRCVRSPLSILRIAGLRAARYPWLRRCAERFLQRRPTVRSRIRNFLLAVPSSDDNSRSSAKSFASTRSRPIVIGKQAGWSPQRVVDFPTESLRAVGLWAAGRPWLRQKVERALQRYPAVRERTRRFLRSAPAFKPDEGPRRNTTNTADPRTKIPGTMTQAGGQKTVYYYWIDHTVNCATNTGMQRVVRWLARAMLENGEDLVFVKWEEQGKRLILATQSDLQRLSLWSGPILPEEMMITYPVDEAALVEPDHIGTREGWLFVPEVTHITFHSEPPTLDAISCAKALGLKVAFIFYDAIPLKVEGYADCQESHAAYMQHLAVADVLLPISQFASEDLASFYVERQGFTSETMPHIVALPLPGENYDNPRVHCSEVAPSSYRILCVGTIEPRKNQTGLITAFNELVRRHPTLPLQLSLVGNLHPIVAPVVQQALRDNPKIEYLHYVTDQELWGLYDECCFTVFSSVEEGFGLPIVESLWRGKPCVCANFGAMGELAAGGGCLAVDVRSPDELMEAMERLLVDVELRARLTAEAVSRPIKTWREYARECVDPLRQLSAPVGNVGRVLYWVEHTSVYPANSGIQRVVRGLAKSLLDNAVKLIPVKWNQAAEAFYPASMDDLLHLEKWNGPKAHAWGKWHPGSFSKGDWLLVPELTTYGGGPDLSRVTSIARDNGLQTSIIFYDSLPYKMTDIYPPEATRAHTHYMKSLLQFDRVFSISHTSHSELFAFLCREGDRLVNVDEKLRPIVLPGEFLESERCTQYREEDVSVIKILAVGTIEPRKNHLALLEAFDLVTRRTTRKIHLTLVGAAPFPDLEDWINSFSAKHPNVSWRRDADDSHLKELYSQCHLSVYPSLEEGFGLPILESLWHARPCICRNSSAMAEVAEGGGCLTVDTSDVNALADAILELVENDALRHQLGEEAIGRPFKTWRQYAEGILREMGPHQPMTSVPAESEAIPKFLADYARAPRLSICITTYNRASWLAVSLVNLLRRVRSFGDAVEVIVCDNASTDSTPDVVKPYLEEKNFRYYRNRVNVGMLGNLKVTAHHSRGQYVWILGDDDLVREGAVDRVLSAIETQPTVELLYLNYAYTRISEAEKVGNIEEFLLNATPIVPPSPDKVAMIKEISTLSENFFTAIYCLVFRRDHALRAYSQDTNGRPFSSLPTCIPTSFYVCHNMFNKKGYWIGEPCVVVNMNVSWGSYAPLWILERIPELYDLAEKMGADPDAVDGWRRHTLEGAVFYLDRIFTDDPEGNLVYFSMERWIRRHKHLREFKLRLPQIMDIYGRAFRSGVEAARESPERLMEIYGLVDASGR